MCNALILTKEMINRRLYYCLCGNADSSTKSDFYESDHIISQLICEINFYLGKEDYNKSSLPYIISYFGASGFSKIAVIPSPSPQHCVAKP
jgi:hypothetical protein